MKIENGLLFLAAYQLSGNPRFYEQSCISACVPIRNISHMKEHSHNGKVYTVLRLANGDEVIANATIPDMVQLITDADAMNLFGNVPFEWPPVPHVVMEDLDVRIPDFTKCGMIEPSHEDYGIH